MGNNTSRYLTREAILSGFKTRDVEAFGGTVLVREVPADLIQQLMDKGFVNPDTREIDLSKISFVELAARCIVDPETSAPMFTRDDLEALGQAGFGSIQRVATVAMQLTGWTSEQRQGDQVPN